MDSQKQNPKLVWLVWKGTFACDRRWDVMRSLHVPLKSLGPRYELSRADGTGAGDTLSSQSCISRSTVSEAITWASSGEITTPTWLSRYLLFQLQGLDKVEAFPYHSQLTLLCLKCSHASGHSSQVIHQFTPLRHKKTLRQSLNLPQFSLFVGKWRAHLQLMLLVPLVHCHLPSPQIVIRSIANLVSYTVYTVSSPFARSLMWSGTHTIWTTLVNHCKLQNSTYIVQSDSNGLHNEKNP